MSVFWEDIKSAPVGVPFFGRADGMVAVCIIYEERAKVIRKKRWPWSKGVEVTEESGQKYLGFALPGDSGYSLLIMRPDRGWYPDQWLPINELQW